MYILKLVSEDVHSEQHDVLLQQGLGSDIEKECGK